jgi:hypothetical protein
MAYRNRATGAYPVSKAELIASRPNVSLPVVWDVSVLDFLGVDEVFPTPQPATSTYITVREGTPNLTPKGTWEQTWVSHDIRTGMDAEGLAFLLAGAKASAKARATDARWQAEVGGISLEGAQIKTDRESQAMLAGANLLAQTFPQKAFDWKAEQGWISIPATQILQISAAVGLHVQGCFSRERELHGLIDQAGTIEAVEAIQITYP